MAHHHSSVNYVEPNISSAGKFARMDKEGKQHIEDWKFNDDYDRAPRLEDYSIYFNLEVEICSRENISANRTITSDVLILSYHTKPNESASTVNFMGGTKVKTGNDKYEPMQYLTTNYADMYVGDLIDYGTTEMIGVKSVDIEYQGACVPVVTVKFTDVRGISLFQPTELSRTNSYQGINGINSDNVAQSFFQCFFRVPMPRFTMTIKGFYGKPVTYECMCDKFDTNFNSKTGDFDITTRFIGYSYSFLTDVSIDALLAAPYSDYGGRNGDYNTYWDKEVNSGRFKIWNKDKTEKIKMPTLFEIWQNMKVLLQKDTKKDTALTEEEKTHEEEIQELQDIKSLYQRWYTTLFNVCVERYGKDYCYLFKKPGDDGDYYRILILIKSSNTETLGKDYEQYPDEFKLINKDLYAAVEKYNSKEGNFRKLNNVSIDFNDYLSLLLFNNTYLGTKGQVVFNGFHKSNKLSETQVVNNVFYGVDYYESGSTAQQIKDNENKHKKHILETIYDDGTDQYTRCYAIDQDYSYLTNRIKALQADANRSTEEKTKEKRLKEINREMFNEMPWYPTVENFTRIMMAHMETLMSLMYSVATKCEGRTADELGVTTGPDGECVDVNAAKDVIPPFPRVTKNVLGDDGITKVEDTWVGDYNRGTKPFEEVDFIDGFFNAIERMQAIKKDTERSLEEAKREVPTESETFGGLIKHPLSSFDFYISKSPYGNSSEISNDLELYQFAGKVAIRMFSILTINYLRAEFPNKFKSPDTLKILGRVEAENFHENVKLTNDKFITMLRDGMITAKSIIEKVTKVNNSEACPWGNVKLFSDDANNIWLDGYKVEASGYSNFFYPIQDVSFSKLKDETHKAFNQGKIISDNGNISIYTIPKNAEVNLDSNNGYGTILITDKIDLPKNSLDNANSDCDSAYTEYYNILCSASTFDDETYTSFFKVNGIPSICSIPYSFKDKQISSFSVNDDKFIEINDGNDNTDEYDNSGIELLVSQAKGGNVDGFTITEVFGVKNGNHDYESSFKKSFQSFNGNLKYNNLTLNLRNAIAILSIKTNIIPFSGKKLKTFNYFPKLAVLQIGAVCFSIGRIDEELYYGEGRTETIDKIIKNNLHVNKEFINKEIRFFVTSISKQARYQYAKYFYDWCLSDIGKKLVTNLTSESNYIKTSEDTNRALLNKNSDFVKSLTNDLTTPILIISLCVNLYKEVERKNFPITQGEAEIYLDAFIKRLKELCHINTTNDSSGNLIKTTDEPHQTTNDMKMELYRYMKQLYDKWIPMSSFDDWTLENYFVDESNALSDAENKGHKFYFIDSYYNNIGDKLLINPKNLMERIDGLLGNGDVNAMMLGFMADIYAYNRCMMKCIQNFFNLTRKNSMNEMFVPMPYNTIDWANGINKYSSFVIVYPYEPSKNLNIPNNEYNDDGFMLNDETDTPKAIRSKTDDEKTYRIPAFGVAYGKQYQSYFKSVNINMKSPVATQQSIEAKHYILQQNANVKSKGVAAQDLYDVYSTQSYTCDVEMMGCAWIQPLMYFVLLNVPMFRGSYLIMKVKHSIKPGDMTTTFTGCRMANVSNKLVEDIFTDDGFLANGEYGDGSTSDGADDRTLKADVDNDCPYKIFPLWGGGGTDLSNELDRKVQLSDCQRKKDYDYLKNDTILMALSRIAANEGGQASRKLELQEMLVATTMYNRRVKSGNYKWIFWHGQYDLIKAKKTTPQQWVIDIVRNIFTQSPSWILTKYNKTTVTNGSLKAWVNSKNFSKGQKIGSTVFTLDDLRKIKYFGNYHEYATGSNKYVLTRPAVMAEDATEGGTYGHCFNTDMGEPFMWEAVTKPSTSDVNDKKDVNQAFFDAVNASAQATPSINVSLIKNKVGDYYTIIQSDKKSDKLGIVFDMILNSEYYNYVQKLYWVYPTNGLNGDPAHIDYIAAESPKQTEKTVRVAQSGKIAETESNQLSEDASEKLLRSLAKYRAKVGDKNIIKDVPQLKDKLTILDKYKPKDCDSLFSTSDGTGGGSIEGFSGLVTNEKMKKVLSNIKIYYREHEYGNESYKRAVRKAWNDKTPLVSGVEVDYGKCTCGPSTWYNNAGNDLFFWDSPKTATYNNTKLGQCGMKMVWHGTVDEAKQLPISKFRPGDVCTQYYNTGKGPSAHGCMWTGTDWRSDFVQYNRIMANQSYTGRGGDYAVCIWRHPDFQEPNLPLA